MIKGTAPKWLYLILLLPLISCTRRVDPVDNSANEEVTGTENLSYLDPALPPAERAEILLGQMTLSEKIGEMTLVEKDSIVEKDISRLGIGALLSGGGGAPRINQPEDWLKMVNGFQEKALESRLGIPILYGVDAVHGHNNVFGAVLFPHNIGLGAAGNAELVEEIGRVTALEMAATGIYWNYAPAVSVPQDIRWGRTYEGYSEKTELVTELSSAYLAGLQGDDLANVDTVMGTPKHFIGDGGTLWGSSSTADYLIDQGDTRIDEEGLRALHLPPYVAAIEAGARSIMVSFSSWNGTKMHAQKYLISDVLKGELGFTGFVVSDWEAINQIDSNYYAAVVAAINAGIDMNMVPYDYREFIDTLTTAVENGDVPQERIDDAVWRILRVKFELGLFERPLSTNTDLDAVGSANHRALARQAVRESLVLLHHDGETLPLGKETAVVFVAGEGADDIGMQSGGWSIEWQGAVGNITPGTTILDGIEATISADTQLFYNRFGNFERVTAENGEPIIAEVGVIVVGERPYAEGRGDSDELYISAPELVAIERLRASSEKLVVIILSGRPLIITDILPQTDAVIAAWLPGTEGQGIADLLFGDYEFRGTLPYTWPRDMAQLPFDFDTLPTTGCDGALFPVGHGLKTSNPVYQLPMCP